MSGPGTVWGVGLGPGEPELMTVRADRLIRGAAHVAFFRKAGRAGRARTIVEGMLRPDAVEIAMDYPVTTEIPVADPRYNRMLAAFYEDCTARLRKLADAGEAVVVLCEGDPFFYGSFMHLHARLTGRVPVRVVPAVTGMSAAWTATGQPITWGDDVLTVLAGTLPEAELARRMADADALVVMKLGRNLAKVRRALEAAGRLADAWLVECASMAEERVVRLAETARVAPRGTGDGTGAAALAGTDAGPGSADGMAERPVPYFSIVLVHGAGRRP